METKYFWLLQKEKNQELRIEKICGTVNPADLMTKHLDGKCLMMLCELLNIKHLGGRPSSAPKLTIDTEYISRESRALAAMTQLKQAAACEIAVHSGAEHEMWIDGYRVDLDSSCVDNRGYRYALYSYGVDVVESWECRYGQWHANTGRGQTRLIHPDEDHDREERPSRALQK